MKLVALRRIRYPRGRDARELNPGDEFETVSDRDGKAFLAAKYAKRASEYQTRAMAPERQAPEVKPVPVVNIPADETPTKRVYKRRDMVAEDN